MLTNSSDASSSDGSAVDGSPAGAPGMAPVHLGGRLARLRAYLVDVVACVFLTAPLALILDDTPGPLNLRPDQAWLPYLNPYAGDPAWRLTLASNVVYVLYFWVQHALWGRTLGKRLLRLKVISTVTGEPPGFGAAALRTLASVGAQVIPYVGLFVAIIDPLPMLGRDRRCLHDLIAGTVVIHLPRSSREKG